MKTAAATASTALLIAALALTAAAQRREVIQMENRRVDLPFSPAVRSGETLYLSGMLGRNPGTGEFEPDAGLQTQRTLEALGRVLATAGMSFADVVSANVYLSDIRHFEAMNEAYRRIFDSRPPVRTTIEAGLAARDALVEISLIAVDSTVSRRFITPEGWAEPASPYSWGILAGDTLYLSGLVSEDPVSGEIIGGNAASQTRRILSNVKTLMAAAGMDSSRWVSSRVYLSEARDFSALNEVYGGAMPAQPPVRATVGASLAHPELKVEIQCVAHRTPTRTVVGTAIPNRPFSPGLVVGKRLFLAGMLGRGAGGLAPDVATQTRQALDNIEAALRQAGLGFEDVIDATVYLTDMRYFGAMNQVYADRVTGQRPPRATVETALMLPEALVEIIMTAAMK